MPRAVRMSTTRTLPSVPGKTEYILQIVFLNDDHVADTQIYCGNLPLVALVELLKVLILSSSAELLMERL